MAGYTRQSSYSDGDTITAAHSNNEFDQVLAAFNNSTGHKHDGTAAEGPVIGLIGDPGETTPKNKVVVDNPNNQIEVSIDVSGTSTEQVVFKDGVIEPTTDNDIDLGSSSKQFKDLHINGTANIDSLAADTANIDGGSIDGATLGTNSAITQAVIDNVNINGATIGHTDDTDLMTLASGVLTVAGEVSMTTLDIGGTNVTSTAAELNLMDGGTSAGTTAVAGSDGIVTNDGGTMRQTTVDTFDTYLAATTKTLTNKTLDADNNTVSNLEVDNLKSGVLDTDLSSVAGTDTTLASAKAIKAYVDSQVTAQDLDFQGDSGGALSIDLDSETLDIAGGTGIDTSGSSNTLTVAIDSTVATLSGSQTLTNKTIDASQLSGTVANARLDAQLQDVAGLAVTDGNFIVGDGSNFVAESGATARSSLGLGTAATSASTDFVAVSGDSVTGDINFGDNVALNLGASTDISLEHNTTNGNLLTVATNPLEVHQAGTNSVMQVYRDQGDGTLMQFFGGTSTERGSIATDTNILKVSANNNFEVRVNNGELAADFTADGAARLYHDASAKFATTSGGVSVTGEVAATSLDISGDADIDGTLEADAITVNGTALNTVIANEATALAIALG